MPASKYTKQIEDEIFLRIAEGETLTDICKEKKYPHIVTVLSWVDQEEKYPGILNRYRRAREAAAEEMDRLILNEIDTATVESVQLNRFRADNYKWRAAKLWPKRFSDRTTHAGDEDAPIVHKAMEMEFVPSRKDKS